MDRHLLSSTSPSPPSHKLDTSPEQLDAEIAWTEQLRRYIQQNLSGLKSKRNSFATTAHLPVEVLAEIMVAACDLQISENNRNEEVYPVSLPVPLILGHVCVSWRALAFSISKLWATVPLALCKRRYESQVVLLDEWLARAGTIQPLYLILTLKYDYAEQQYWRDYPPREVLAKLYARSMQWHTFYSTLPNLCMDIFTTVYGRLPRLHTLILNRSGRLAYDVFYPPAPAIPPPPTTHGQHNNVQTTAVITGVDYHGATSSNPGAGTAPPPPPDLIRHWGMLSDAPSLQSVSLPEGLSPFEMQLPWNQITHLELRTIPLYDCLRVLEHTPLIESCDFYGVYSTMIPTPGTHAFFPPPPLPPNPFISPVSTYTGSGLYLAHLNRLKLFADPANLAHFLESITAPSLASVIFKSTTIALAPVTAQLLRLVERSGSQPRHLEICVPNIGKAAEQLVTLLSAREMKGLEEICLESWQVDVEGLGDWFWEKMMPVKKVQRGHIHNDSGGEHDEFGIERLSMPTPLIGLDSGSTDLNNNCEGGVHKEKQTKVQPVEDEYFEEVEENDILLPNLTSIVYKGTLSFNPKTLKDMIVSRWRRKPRKIIAADKMLHSTYLSLSPSNARMMRRTPLPAVPLDPLSDDEMSGQLRDPPESLLFSTNGGDASVPPNSLSSTPDPPSPSVSPSPSLTPASSPPGPTPYFTEPMFASVPDSPPVPCHECFAEYQSRGHSHLQNSENKSIREEKEEETQETYYPTAQLQAFEIVALEMEFKIPIDDDTNLAFQELVREGFRLRVITRRGSMAF